MNRRMSRQEVKEARKHLRKENKRYGDELVQLSTSQFDKHVGRGSPPYLVYRNARFLVQMFHEEHGVRMTVNRTEIKSNGDWEDGITWDELYELKKQVGLGDAWGYECYPPKGYFINDANMRHIFIPHEAVEQVGWM